MRGSTSAIIAVGLAVAGAVGITVYVKSHKTPAATAPVPATQAVLPATLPATLPTTVPVKQLGSYIDWVHRATPLVDAKLEENRLPRADAAHLRLQNPCYICPRGDLWLTHPDAPPVEDVLRSAPRVAEHLTRDRIVYVFWDVSEQGTRRATAVIQPSPGVLTLVRPDGLRKDLTGLSGDWSRARASDDAILLPGKTDLAILTVWPEVKTRTFPLAGPLAGSPASAPAGLQATAPGQVGDDAVQLIPTSESVLAFIPQYTSAGPAARVLQFTDGNVSTLSDSTDWKGPFVHLVPRADGSVLQIRPGDEAGLVRLSAAPLEKADIPRQTVVKAVEQLSSDDPAVRDRAERQLIAMGPGIWPILAELLPKQPPEATFRIQDILAARTEPRLGNMRLVGDRLKVAGRFADGVLFFADSGVQIARSDGNSIARTEAWIATRDTGAITAIPEEMARSLMLGETTVSALDDDWIVGDAGHGSRLFYGKEFLPLTGKDELAYTSFVGRDRQGRLLLQRPGRDQYVLIDPWLADPTPRLPVWQLVVDGGEAGWDQDNWPAMKKTQAWSLHEAAWQPLQPPKGKFSNEASPSPASAASGLLVTLADGTVVRGGKTEVVFSRPGFEDFTLPLTASLEGKLPVVLAAAVNDQRVFLFNAAGRMIRLGREAGARQWRIEGAFDKGVPNIVNPGRLWVDPAGRLCMTWDGNSLALMFPAGRLPPAIADLMPQDQVKLAQER